MEICDITFSPAEPCLIKLARKARKKNRNLEISCKITKTPLTLAENVFMSDSIAYNKKQIENIGFQGF